MPLTSSDLRSGGVADILRAVARGGPVDLIDIHGVPLLCVVVETGRVDLLEALLAMRPRPDVWPHRPGSAVWPLHAAVQQGPVAMVAALIAAGADPRHVPAGATRSAWATAITRHAAPDVMSACIAGGVDPAAAMPDADGFTPIRAAALLGHLDTVAWLAAIPGLIRADLDIPGPSIVHCLVGGDGSHAPDGRRIIAGLVRDLIAAGASMGVDEAAGILDAIVRGGNAELLGAALAALPDGAPVAAAGIIGRAAPGHEAATLAAMLRHVGTTTDGLADAIRRCGDPAGCLDALIAAGADPGTGWWMHAVRAGDPDLFACCAHHRLPPDTDGAGPDDAVVVAGLASAPWRPWPVDDAGRAAASAICAAAGIPAPDWSDPVAVRAGIGGHALSAIVHGLEHRQGWRSDADRDAILGHLRALLAIAVHPDAVPHGGDGRMRPLARTIAVRSGVADPVVKLLLDAGADPDGTPAARPLVVAATHGYRGQVAMLLAAGADPALAGADGRDPLMAAIRRPDATDAFDAILASGRAPVRPDHVVALAEHHRSAETAAIAAAAPDVFRAAAPDLIAALERRLAATGLSEHDAPGHAGVLETVALVAGRIPGCRPFPTDLSALLGQSSILVRLATAAFVGLGQDGVAIDPRAAGLMRAHAGPKPGILHRRIRLLLWVALDAPSIPPPTLFDADDRAWAAAFAASHPDSPWTMTLFAALSASQP